MSPRQYRRTPGSYPNLLRTDVLAGGMLTLYRNPAGRPFGESDAYALSAEWSVPEDIPDAYEKALEEERRLSCEHAFAWSPEFGYLSPVPSHCGTGLFIDADVHLEALHIIGDLPPVLAALDAVRIGYRGIEADGIRNAAHLFRICNESAIGVNERTLLARVTRVYVHLAEQETAARKVLVEEHPRLLADAIERSLAILRNARLLSSCEYLDLLSPIRLAAIMGFLEGITRRKVDQILRHQFDRPFAKPPSTLEEERMRDARDADFADQVNAVFSDVRLNKFAKDILS